MKLGRQVANTRDYLCMKYENIPTIGWSGIWDFVQVTVRAHKMDFETNMAEFNNMMCVLLFLYVTFHSYPDGIQRPASSGSCHTLV